MKHLLIIALITCCLTPGSAQDATTVLQAIHFIKLANTLREVNKSEDAVSLLKRALPVVQQRSPYYEAVANEMLGFSYNDLEEYETAVKYLEQARSQYANLKFVASAWGVNEVIRDISGKNVYAGIQIGVNDVKLAIFKTQYESDFYEKDIRSVIDVPDVSMVADASGSLRKGQIALKTCLDSIQRYNIPNERVFIVFSSDVANGPNKNRIYDELTNALPTGSNLHIDTTLTPAREAELFTIGAIPRKVWPTTSALNIGANSIMGGYFDKNTGMEPKKFHYNATPIGVNTIVEQADGKKSPNIDAFKREAERIVDAIPAAKLVSTDKGFQQRRTVGIGGSAVQALVTYLYPDKALVTAVPITTADVERFKRMALNDYAALIQPDLNAVADVTVRNKATAEARATQNQLTQKQLIAGALLLEATVKAYNNQSPSLPKRFVFIRDSDIGWVTGKFLETINYEYESTIAKGALYTR